MDNKNTLYPRIYCNKATINTVHKWMCHFMHVYGRDFTYEEVILRALDCLQYKELNVADAFRKQELEWKHKHELIENHKNSAK